MSKQLMEVVLPRLARRLYNQLQRYRAGELDDNGFTQAFETLLQRQHVWLAERGVSDARAAVAIHGAVLVLSGPGLRAEAAETGLPLEVIEFRAVRAAAADIAANYGVCEDQMVQQIAGIVARYGD
ncbi:MAG TPA: hypothetical protein VFA18_11825 [Gemmataceae bacterium]|nr:hypothetical protein [Gemmataceae bacterium]